ncbi:MAG TPA: hypothetical protein VGQ83_00950 [Polyangia bacterium]
MSGYVKFEFSQAQDPGGARMRDALVAHFRYERLGAIRVGLVHAVALGGAFPCVVAGWPGALRRSTAAFGLALWAVGFLALLVVGALEYRWYRRLVGYATERSGPAGGRP